MKRLLRDVVKKAGYEFYRYDARFHLEFAITHLEKICEIDCILDVGANKGQFATEMRASGVKAKMISFEPLADAHAILVEKAQSDPKWEVAPRMAIGDKKGEVEFYIAGNSVSSSILEMAKLHEVAAPGSKQAIVERVAVSTLDAERRSNASWGGNRFLLKIDTQGYEPQVIEGALDLLADVVALQCEVSLVELYKGQMLYAEFVPWVLSLGYEIYRIEPGFSDRQTGQNFQVDITFVRKQEMEKLGHSSVAGIRSN